MRNKGQANYAELKKKTRHFHSMTKLRAENTPDKT